MASHQSSAVAESEEGTAIHIAVAHISVFGDGHHTARVVAPAGGDVHQTHLIQVGVQCIAEKTLILGVGLVDVQVGDSKAVAIERAFERVVREATAG